MKLGPIPRYFWWLATLAMLVLGGTLWLWSRLVWTPVQRYYLGAYLWCSLPGSDPASSIEIRWLYKTAANAKPELALEDDAVASPLNAHSQIPMDLSPAVQQAGWTGLMQGPVERLQIARLKPLLEEQFFDGRNLWLMVLLPLLFGFVLLCFLLYGLSWLADWIEDAPWRAPRFPWQEPSPPLLQKWITKVGKARSRFSGLAMHWRRKTAPKETETAPTAASVETPKKAPQPAYPLFGASDGVRKRAFLWTEKDEIE